MSYVTRYLYLDPEPQRIIDGIEKYEPFEVLGPLGLHSSCFEVFQDTENANKNRWKKNFKFKSSKKIISNERILIYSQALPWPIICYLNEANLRLGSWNCKDNISLNKLMLKKSAPITSQFAIHSAQFQIPCRQIRQMCHSPISLSPISYLGRQESVVSRILNLMEEKNHIGNSDKALKKVFKHVWFKN